MTFYITLFITMIFAMAMYLEAASSTRAPGFLERAFGPGRIPPLRGRNPEYFRDAVCLGILVPPR